MREYSINYDYYHKKCDSIDAGIDYLRLVFRKDFNIEKFILGIDYYWDHKDLYNVKYDKDEKDIDISCWLDYDNTNFCTLTICNELLTASLVHVKGTGPAVMFTCVYNGVSVPIFMYRYYKGNHILDFYGAFYRLLSIKYLDNNFIDTLLWYWCIDPDYCYITRLDYRIDFFMNSSCSIPKPHDFLLHNINASHIRYWWVGNKLTNWQVWDKNSRTLITRLYDKLLDTKKKWKDFLYFDYFRYENVHRLEFECDIKLCKPHTYSTLDKLLWKVQSIFWLNNEKRLQPIFYRYNTNKLTYTRKEIDQYMSYVRKAINRLNFNYISSNLEEELNPLNICIDYISDYNINNHILTYETLTNHSTYLNNRIRYFSKRALHKLKK